jgi:hypothetical protein
MFRDAEVLGQLGCSGAALALQGEEQSYQPFRSHPPIMPVALLQRSGGQVKQAARS